MLRVVVVVGMMVAPGATALAFCPEPSLPNPPPSYLRPTKPTVPLCVNQFQGTHTCDDWVVSTYNADVERYNAGLDGYFRALETFVAEAERYAADAYRFATCEIDDLR